MSPDKRASRKPSSPRPPAILPLQPQDIGPKHPVALPKKNRPSKPQRSQREMLADARARNWADVLGSLEPNERAHLEQMSLSQETSLAPQWHLLEVPDGEFPTVHSFTTLEDLVARLKDVVEEGGSRVFPFRGERLQVSVGPFRHLMLSDSEPIPLFEMPEAILADESGYLGDPDDDPETLAFESPRLAAMQDSGPDGLEEIGQEEGVGGWSDQEDPADDDELDQPE